MDKDLIFAPASLTLIIVCCNLISQSTTKASKLLILNLFSLKADSLLQVHSHLESFGTAYVLFNNTPKSCYFVSRKWRPRMLQVLCLSCWPCFSTVKIGMNLSPLVVLSPTRPPRDASSAGAAAYNAGSTVISPPLTLLRLLHLLPRFDLSPQTTTHFSVSHKFLSFQLQHLTDMF